MSSKHDDLTFRVAQHYMEKGLQTEVFKKYLKGEFDVWVTKNGWTNYYIEVKSYHSDKAWKRACKQFSRAKKFYHEKELTCIYIANNKDGGRTVRRYK